VVPVDAPVDAALGTMERPAASCAELLSAFGPASGVYWVRHPNPARPAFETYCEQVVDGGGWALVYSSVFRSDGTTTAFWNIPYADRFTTKGNRSADDNYYDGPLYLTGTAFLDTVTDVDGKTAVLARVDTQGFDPDTMRFIAPRLVVGDGDVFESHFNAGWSSADRDGDTEPSINCAVFFQNVSQHYGACWRYNLGADADEPFLDGGVGPHVFRGTLLDLGLAEQRTTGAGTYSQVRRIARHVRW
jgi:hypothetical protein